MKITTEEIQHIANLARLNLSESELATMTGQLGKILNYVDTLEKIDTTGIPPTTHAVTITNAFREDSVRPSLDREAALANAPKADSESFIVPKIL